MVSTAPGTGITKMNKTWSLFRETHYNRGVLNALVTKEEVIKSTETRSKERKIKSIKLEMKMERSQQTTQKYKGS